MNSLLVMSSISLFAFMGSCFRNVDGHNTVRTKTCLDQLELMIHDEISQDNIPDGLFSSKELIDFIEPSSMGHCLKDAWNNWFQIYHNTNDNSLKIWSFGPDGVDDEGENDDIVKVLKLHNK